MNINCLIVDDDPYIRSELAKLLDSSAEGTILMAAFEDPLEAMKYIEKSPPNILFLDIQMPQMSGFKMLDLLGDIHFEVIFITSFNEYAVKAIRYSAFDYLLKPIQSADLKMSLERYRQRKEKLLLQSRLSNLKHNLSIQSEKELQLIVGTKQGEYRFSPGKIIRCEADSNYTMIHSSGSKKFMASKTLREIEEQLTGAGFLRVHKSHLVNPDYIVEFLHQNKIVMKDMSHVPVSRRRAPLVKLHLAV